MLNRLSEHLEFYENRIFSKKSIKVTMLYGVIVVNIFEMVFLLVTYLTNLKSKIDLFKGGKDYDNLTMKIFANYNVDSMPTLSNSANLNISIHFGIYQILASVWICFFLI